MGQSPAQLDTAHASSAQLMSMPVGSPWVSVTADKPKEEQFLMAG